MKRSLTFTVMATIAAVGFGSGAVWLGAQGLQLTVSNNSSASQTASVAKSSATPPDTLTILIGGDIMLDRDVRALGLRYGYDSLFDAITPLLSSADITIANLEGPVTSSSSRTFMPDGTYGTDLQFTFSPTALPALVHAGIDVVSLANNHTDNFGASGFAETKKWLTYTGLDYFGDPWNDSGTEKIISQNGISVAFVGYHAFQPGFEHILADVKRLSAAGDFVIVMPHWGVEYSALATSDMKMKARQLANAGAGAIVGSHPHVVGEQEWLGGVPVYYSLGNLLFDQYFSTATMTGELVELTLGKNGKTPILDSIKTFTVSNASKRGITLVQ